VILLSVAVLFDCVFAQGLAGAYDARMATTRPN
jgi:hypothetical protein